MQTHLHPHPHPEDNAHKHDGESHVHQHHVTRATVKGRRPGNHPGRPTPARP